MCDFAELTLSRRTSPGANVAPMLANAWLVVELGDTKLLLVLSASFKRKQKGKLADWSVKMDWSMRQFGEFKFGSI